ncbi:MAG TPA: AI-2E family transporter, partial [Intrasporangium sp.]|nr:AI-2E family transporter [Intrasporangium sp.]
MWRRWTDYRRAQRHKLAQIREGRHGTSARDVPQAGAPDLSEPGEQAVGDGRPAPDLVTSTLGGPPGVDGEAAGEVRAGSATDAPAGGPPEPEASGERSSGRNYGPIGTPFNRQSPFYIGFVGALGVLVAYAFVQAIGKLDTTITLLLVALFLSLALNPIVEALTRAKIRRGLAVAIVFFGLLVVFALLGWVVIPPVATQSTDLANNAPKMLDGLLQNQWVQEVDHRYQVIARIQEEINKRVADGNLWAGIFGGVLETGKVLLGGVFSVLTVLVLTLYFLASLPSLKQAAYALVPATRRRRIISLAEEIMRRVGSYAIGQVAVAAINAFCSWIMMTLL